MLGLAGRIGAALQGVKNAPVIQQRLAGGGKELLGHSALGGLWSGASTAMFTGNPVAGLAVGAADALLSAGAAKQLGKYYTVTPPGSKVSHQEYRPSGPQSALMIGTSIAAPMLVEPIFASSQIAGLSQQELQQLSAEPVVMDQTATAEQQLMQRQAMNPGSQEALSPGTMFQMQGVESSLFRGAIDPYALTRGAM
jgi:hypothetical protein